MATYRFDCKVCDQPNREQQNIPEIRYIELSPGKWANCQPCNECLAKIIADEKEAAARAIIAKKEAEIAAREEALKHPTPSLAIEIVAENTKKKADATKNAKAKKTTARKS